MNRKLRPGKKYWFLILCLPLVLLTCLAILLSPRGILPLRQLNKEYQQLSQDNLALEKENRQLYQEINGLRNDLAPIERLAREDLGMVREGELMFQFVSPPPTKRK